MMRKRLISWRATAIITWLVWLVSFLLRVFVIGMEPKAHDVFTPERFIVLHVLFLLTLAVLMVSPLTFRLYVVCFGFCGLTRLVDGDSLIGLFMYLLSGAFSLKQGFFRRHARVKCIASTLILCSVIASQLRYGVPVLLNTLLDYALPLLMLLLAAALFQPELAKLLAEQRARVLPLDAARFTERDVAILRSILAGHKYESIAREYGIAMITLKKQVRSLFYRIDVGDRINFLARYSNYTIQRVESVPHTEA